MEEKDKTLKWTKPSLKKITCGSREVSAVICSDGSAAVANCSSGASPAGFMCYSGGAASDCLIGTGASCAGGGSA